MDDAGGGAAVERRPPASNARGVNMRQRSEDEAVQAFPLVVRHRDERLAGRVAIS
jgi:hypothetical protein